MSEALAGSVVDALGIKTNLDDGDLVAGGVLLLKVVEADGQTRLSVWWSDGMSWLEKAGIMRIAERQESGSAGFCDGEHD